MPPKVYRLYLNTKAGGPVPISQFILDADEQNLIHLRERNLWMVQIRWAYIFILTAVGVISNYFSGTHSELIPRYFMLGMIGLGINFILWLAANFHYHKSWYYQGVALLQIALDLSLASILVYSQGGINSRGTALYAIPILTSGVLFMRASALVTAFLSCIAYTASIVLHALHNRSVIELHELTAPAIFYSFVFIILAVTVTRFSRINSINDRENSYSQLLSMMRHQLRHPSSVIAAIIDVLEHSASSQYLSFEQKKYIGLIKQENWRMHRMITNLLETARQGGANEMSVSLEADIGKLVRTTAENCALGNNRLHDLVLDIPAEPIIINTQPIQLQMALDNIVDNAFRYSSVTTTVEVKVTVLDDNIVIDVTDHGRGLSPNQQRMLFKRFSHFEKSENSTDARKGDELYTTGLGLHVSKLIIERQGGTLDVISTIDKGTTVTITLLRRQ
jgi:signal transduction histidine kinase